ncbi:hypothetical protein FOIG_15990 [Fusarium odoratissimum NRRL 54006]|nr:uncharacterized protein FOIG_15990 [Fusarium odoratissimum NRRL 54006]EXL90782.1 hypothetical protein FOIG_15990 [Fusarium odoratissimum NRRL 54006]
MEPARKNKEVIETGWIASRGLDWQIRTGSNLQKAAWDAK